MIKSVFHLSFALVGTLLLTSCAGYRLGSVPYAELKGVEKIYVPVVKNESFEPGIQVMVTNAIIRRFSQDGTYETGRQSESDATLEVVITDLKRDSLRRARSNSLVTEEYRLDLIAKVTFINHRTGQKLFENEIIIGDTSYEIIKRITEGW